MNIAPFAIADRQRHNLEPGSPEWLAHRAQQLNAGDAGAMLGVGITSRTELMDELVMGFGQDVSHFQQRIFDSGHRVEALARPLAERIMGEDLYPFVYSASCTNLTRRLGASVDGAPFARTAKLHWECKSLNDELRTALQYSGQADIANNDARRLPKKYRAQMCQQALVRGSETVLFSACQFDDAGNVVDERHAWYEPEQELCVEVLRGWIQFEVDLASHKPVVHQERAQGEKVEAMGLPMVRVMGSVVESNLPQWKALAFARIEALNLELKTDEQFGQAEQDVKWCEESEKALKKLKVDVIAQMASVEEVTSTLDAIVGRLAAARKALDSKVAERKVAIRTEVCNHYERQAGEHRNKMVERIRALDVSPHPHLLVPELSHIDVGADFPKSIKGLKTVKSLHNAASSHLATVKIALSAVTDTIETNLRYFKAECTDWRQLFVAREMPDLVLKPAEDFAAVCTSRITEAKRIEQERRDREEQQRIQREAEAERQRNAEEARQRLAAQAATPAPVAAPATHPNGAPMFSTTTFRDDGQPIMLNADGTRSVFCDVDEGAEAPERKASPSAAVVPLQRPAAAPSTPSTPPTLRLGQINERLAPLALTADGLRLLGFEPAAKDRAAVLYHEAQFPAICESILAHVRAVQHGMTEAA